MPPPTRWPRKSAISSMRAAWRQARSLMPNLASGCLASASRSTGSASESAASARSRAKMPASVRSSGMPAESSMSRPQRPSSAATRRAMVRSGVTRAAVVPDVSTASRSAKAMASASSCSLWATISETPAMASPVSAKAVSAQRSVVSAGRRASAMSRRRRARAPDGAASGTTSSRRIPILPISCLRPNCGWPKALGGAPSSAPIAAQASASRSWSRPGSTTAPSAWCAMALSRSAVAGIEPVDPAATTGPASRLAAARISVSRRTAGSTRSIPARMAGHCSATICRKSSVIW